jgi:hypothetical protein
MEKPPDINTPGDLLHFLLCKNENGIWFVRVDGKYLSLPRWMWTSCDKACPNAEVLRKE